MFFLPGVFLPAYLTVMFIISNLQSQNNNQTTILGNNSENILKTLLNTSELNNITNIYNDTNISLTTIKPIQFISEKKQCLLTDYLSTFNHGIMLPQITLGDNHMHTNEEQSLCNDDQFINKSHLLYGISLSAFLLLLATIAYRYKQSYIKKEIQPVLELDQEEVISNQESAAAVEINDELDVNELQFLGFYSKDIIELCDGTTEYISRMNEEYLSDAKAVILDQLNQIKECFEKATKSNFSTIATRLNDINITDRINHLHELIHTHDTNTTDVCVTHDDNLHIIKQEEYLETLKQLNNAIKHFKDDFNNHAFDLFKSNLKIKDYTTKCINLNHELNEKIINMIANIKQEQPTQEATVREQLLKNAQHQALTEYRSRLDELSKTVEESTQALQSYTKILDLIIKEHHGEANESLRKQSITCFIPHIIEAIEYTKDPILNDIIDTNDYQTIIGELNQIKYADSPVETNTSSNVVAVVIENSEALDERNDHKRSPEITFSLFSRSQLNAITETDTKQPSNS